MNKITSVFNVTFKTQILKLKKKTDSKSILIGIHLLGLIFL